MIKYYVLLRNQCFHSGVVILLPCHIWDLLQALANSKAGIHV